MRLRREDPGGSSPEDSTEYKTAVKSVIWCEIKSLLQKLAAVTGEESIVISTNLTEGTYSHLGSFLGQEYLDDREDHILSLCTSFSQFCSGLQNHAVVLQEPETVFKENEREGPSPGPQMNPRKRPLTPDTGTHTHHHKRKSTHPHSLHGKSDQTAHFDKCFMNQSRSADIDSVNQSDGTVNQFGKYDTDAVGKSSKQKFSVGQIFKSISSQIEKQINKGSTSSVWIKTEPVDEFTIMSENGDLSDSISGRNSESLSPSEQTSPQQSIINRPMSLIPLGNIRKKTSPLSKHIKEETYEKEEVQPLPKTNEENLPTKSSILRSLYEQPLYQFGAYMTGNDSAKNEEQQVLNLPQNLEENFETFPQSSENPVLSGFYDSDNYPRYKQRKNPVKKSKTKDKATSLLGLEESPSTPTNSTKDNLHMRTFESGGRLVYACDVCKRELSHLTSYRRHMKLHTMERPHKCPVCLKGFIRKYHCIDHLNKHHKGVEFCPESLLLTGASRELYGGPVNTDQSALSDSHSISPGEFNYTLDQSLEASSDPDQSVNADISIDQSASSILSELARSAAKENIQVKEASNLPEVIKTKGMDIQNESAEMLKSAYNDIESKSIENEAEIQLNNDSATLKAGNGSMARKYEVAEGIKAIVAHLKKKKQLKDTEQESADHLGHSVE
ncbi:zinc finger E-box-binding homeobox 1-like [Mya arenaria]|uniref:zinc finger E-box-binding homeobox 1-like n=1 Tax=Mya arenaria TaxID=6604 RepID=UPI0022E8F550|nr:zinc finger E-box-binding homeobox 1-like [Mya arenaria]